MDRQSSSLSKCASSAEGAPRADAGTTERVRAHLSLPPPGVACVATGALQARERRVWSWPDLDAYDLLDAGDCVTVGPNASDAWCLPSVHIIGTMKGSTNELSTWLAENPLLEKPPHEVTGRIAGGLWFSVASTQKRNTRGEDCRKSV